MLKMTEKLVLITPMLENTPYLLIFPFLFVCLFTQVGPWGTHANPWKIHEPFQAHTKCTSLDSQCRLIKMHAGPDSFDKQSKKWKKIARKRRKERRPLPTTLYNFTLSPYFVRKETGIPISSPDAKALFCSLCFCLFVFVLCRFV